MPDHGKKLPSKLGFSKRLVDCCHARVGAPGTKAAKVSISNESVKRTRRIVSSFTRNET
jgi:hypothetical protein